MSIVPVSILEQELAEARTPKESFLVEAKSAGNLAYAKEQRDYEKAFGYALTWIKAQCKTTELIGPTITKFHGNRHVGPNDSVRSLDEYGFTWMQWNRRSQVLDAFRKLGDKYTDDCVVKGVLPTPYGLMGYYKKTIPKPSQWVDYPFRGLAFEIIADGIRMAALGDIEAKKWLVEDYKDDDASNCQWLCHEIKKQHDLIVSWVKGGCKTTPLHELLIETLRGLSVSDEWAGE